MCEGQTAPGAKKGQQAMKKEMGTLRHMISACWLCDLHGWGGVARPDHVVQFQLL